MVIAAELINDNGISGVAFAFFTALFTAVSGTVVAIYKLRHKVQEVKDASVSASQYAQQAQVSTRDLTNGLGKRLERKLDVLAVNHDRLETRLEELNASHRSHLEWHLTKEGSE